MKTYSGYIMKLEPNQIFVFGSNTEGRHGKGAAKMAYKYFGAIYGQAYGLQGQCFAICTKDLTKNIHPSISKDSIMDQIGRLYRLALDHPKLDYMIAYTLSTNLNGYTPEEMAQMFVDAAVYSNNKIPENIVFNDGFAKLFRYEEV